MSEPRWHESDSPNRRDGRAQGAPDRYPGMPRDTRPRTPGTGPRFTPNTGPGWDDAAATRRIQAPPELRGRGHRDPGTPRRSRAGGGGSGRQRSGLAGAFGAMPAVAGIAIIAVSALVGAIVTIAQKRDPGTALGVCVVAGTLVAGLAVRPRSAYTLLPVPALSYVFAAFIAGKVHDPSSTSRIGQLVHAGTWLADGFVSMAAATILAIVVFGLRLFLDMRGNPRSRRSGGGPPRPGRGPQQPGTDDAARSATPARPAAGPGGRPYRPDGPPYRGSDGPVYGGTGGTGPVPSGTSRPSYGTTGPSHSGSGNGGQSYGQGTGAHRAPVGSGYENGNGPWHDNPGAAGQRPGPYGADRPPLPDPYRRELPPGR